MDNIRYRQVMDELSDKLWLIQFWNQGEPFLHSNFLDMVAYAKERGLIAITSTNGHFLEENADMIVNSGLDEIIISLDGIDQSTYERHRIGGNYKKVITGIQKLKEAKSLKKSIRPLINLQYLVLKQNENQIDKVKELGIHLGVDIISLKSVQVYTEDQAEFYLPKNIKFRRYQRKDRHFQIKSRLPNWCTFLWYGSVLNWDGSLAPCCFDKDSTKAFGNAFNSSSEALDLWKNPNSRGFRKAILKNRSQFDMCCNCLEGLDQPYVYYHVL
jgi:MoaA/NifB/PqqE/SkfB family radical SAM enzyme